MSDVVKIPRYIDDPPHLLLWSADEVAPIGLGLVLGIFADQLAVFSAIGFAASYIYRRFRDGRPDGFLFHWLYWYGFWPGRGGTVMRNPFERRYLP